MDSEGSKSSRARPGPGRVCREQPPGGEGYGGGSALLRSSVSRVLPVPQPEVPTGKLEDEARDSSSVERARAEEGPSPGRASARTRKEY